MMRLRRALLELKLAKNTKFWNGLREQLPTYLLAEEIAFGYFVVVVFTKEDVARLASIQDVLAEVRKKTKYDLQVVIVDARPSKKSASKL